MADVLAALLVIGQLRVRPLAMSTGIQKFFSALPLICFLSCSSERQVSQPRAQASALPGKVEIRNGQVFLGELGPFVKRSDGHYACADTQGRGDHYLVRYRHGRWSYEWSYVQMRPVPVDASVLEK